MQRGRDAMRRHRMRTGGDIAGAAVSPASTTALVSSSMNKRHAVGTLEDLVDHVGRQAVAAANASDKFGCWRTRLSRFKASAWTCGRPAHGGSKSGRNVTKSRMGSCGTSLDHAIQQLEAGRIDPVHVLEDRHDRPAARRRLDQPPQGLERLLLALLRRQIEPRVASIDAGQGEQLGDQRGVIGRQAIAYDSRTCSLSSFVGGVVVALEPRGALELADDRMERAVGVMRRAEVAQAEMRLAGNAFEQRRGQARLADAGLAGEQDDAALAALAPAASGAAAARAPRRGRAAAPRRPHAGPRSGFPRRSRPMTCHACTGSAKPLSVTAPRSR